MLFLMICIIKKFFDEAYFEEQIERRKHSATFIAGKDKLRMYLKKLDRDGLELFLNMVIECRRQHGLFITDVSSTGFWTKINNACRSFGVNIPDDLNSAEGQTFLNNNRGYYFKTLSTKVIANMLCDAIDHDIEVATSAAKKLYNSGHDAMINYIRHRVGV